MDPLAMSRRFFPGDLPDDLTYRPGCRHADHPGRRPSHLENYGIGGAYTAALAPCLLVVVAAGEDVTRAARGSPPS